MNVNRLFTSLVCFGVCLIGLANTTAQESSEELERPAEAAAEMDLSKRLIELPTETLVAKSVPEQSETNENPACEPGLVDWHNDQAVAKDASVRSGKPVMLFHLLGNLDELFT